MLNSAPTILIFDGSTGAGKSTILEFMYEAYSLKILVGQKITTRKKRQSDNDWEFNFVETMKEISNDFVYKDLNETYAINYEEILKAKNQKLIYAITCTDKKVIQQLKFQFKAIVIYVFRPLSLSDFHEILNLRGIINKVEIQDRWNEVRNVAQDYQEKLELYDFVILNLGKKEDLINQLLKIFLTCSI